MNKCNKCRENVLKTGGVYSPITQAKIYAVKDLPVPAMVSNGVSHHGIRTYNVLCVICGNATQVAKSRREALRYWREKNPPQTLRDWIALIRAMIFI
jgi:hypothetical protein